MPTTGNAVETVDNLIAEARAERYRDSRRVVWLAARALEVAQRVGYVGGVVRSDVEMTFAYVLLREYAHVPGIALPALETAKQMGLQVEEGYILLTLCAYQRRIGQVQEAMRGAHRATEIGRRLNNYELMCFGLINQGIMRRFFSPRDFRQELAYYEQVLDLTAKHDVDVPRAFSYINIAEICLDSGEVKQAIDYARKGVDDAVQHEFADGQLAALHSLCRIHVDHGEFDKAREYIARALGIVQKYDIHAATTYKVLGYMYLQLEDWDSAAHALHEAEKLALRENNYELLVTTYQYLADVYEQRDNYPKALAYERLKFAAREQYTTQQIDSRAQILETMHRVETLETELANQRQSEEQRLQLHRAEMARDMANAISNVKQQLLKRLSHEFRTPLSILRTSFDLLTQYGDQLSEERLLSHRARIDQQFTHITRLLDDILDAVRANAEPIALSPEQTRLLPFCEEAVATACTQVEASRERVVLVADEIDMCVDVSLALSVLVQVVNNALKFSDDTVEVRAHVTGDKIVLAVADQGIGIPADELESVFEPLVRGSNFDVVPGNGLGLTVARKHAEAIGGTIQLESSVDVGTTVTVTLPNMAEAVANCAGS